MRIPKSKHFQLQRLAEDVYAAVASERGYAICNAGIIDTGDRIIVFDTFISPDSAKDLLGVAKRLTPQNAIRVVNSHYHNDHIRGNQVFPPVSTFLARQQLVSESLTKNLRRSKAKRRASPKRLWTPSRSWGWRKILSDAKALLCRSFTARQS